MQSEKFKIVSHSLEETQLLAKKFMHGQGKVKPFPVIGLFGDLGSGKTAFMQGVARALGIKENVLSPTFVIEKIYAIPASSTGKPRLSAGKPDSGPRLVHIDAYRLENAGELERLGFKEILKDPRNIIFIEWADKVESMLPKHAKRIYFKFIDENTREISFD